MAILDILSSIGDVLVSAGSVITAFAAVITAFVACSGVNRWKKELTKKANFDVAIRLLTTLYKFESILKRWNDWCDQNSQDINVDDQRAIHVMFSEGLIALCKAQSDFRSVAFEAEVLWGECGQKIKNADKSLDDIFSNILQNMQTVHSAYLQRQRVSSKKSFSLDLEKNKSEVKKLTNQIDCNITGIKNVVSPYPK